MELSLKFFLFFFIINAPISISSSNLGDDGCFRDHINLPLWICNPSQFDENYYTATGYAKNKNLDIAVLKRIAISKARQELGRQTSIAVSSSNKQERSNQNSSEAYSKIVSDIKLVSLVNLNNVIVLNEWISTATNEVYILIGTPKRHEFSHKKDLKL